MRRPCSRSAPAPRRCQSAIEALAVQSPTLSGQRVGQQAPPQATYPFGQANAGVTTQVDAKVITKRSPIILIIRVALSCLHELRVFSQTMVGEIRVLLPPVCDAHH